MFVHWLFRNRVIITLYLPPLMNLYPLLMLLIHLNLYEEVEVTLTDSGNLGTAPFVERITITLNLLSEACTSKFSEAKFLCERLR